MTANYIKSYLSYLSKLVDQYNITYHHSINKKPINADYSADNADFHWQNWKNKNIESS